MPGVSKSNQHKASSSPAGSTVREAFTTDSAARIATAASIAPREATKARVVASVVEAASAAAREAAAAGVVAHEVAVVGAAAREAAAAGTRACEAAASEAAVTERNAEAPTDLQEHVKETTSSSTAKEAEEIHDSSESEGAEEGSTHIGVRLREAGLLEPSSSGEDDQMRGKMIMLGKELNLSNRSDACLLRGRIRCGGRWPCWGGSRI